MTADTPGTVSDVSAMLVARMIRRWPTARIAASCASPSSDPCSGTTSTPADAADASRQLRAGPFDLARAREKAQDLTGRSRQHAARSFGKRLPFAIFDGQRMSAPGTSMTGASPRNAATRLDLERRRHHDDAQVVAGEPRLPRQRETEIGVDASFVKLVEDDRREIRKQRILLQSRGQNAFGHDEQARVAAEALFESDLPADFAADRPPSLLAIRRATARAATRRGCSRMTGPASSSAGGMRVVLPAPGEADKHDRPAARERLANLRDVRVNIREAVSRTQRR